MIYGICSERMAANLLENEQHGRQAAARNSGPCQPDLQYNPGRRHPVYGPGPLLSGRPPVHHPRPYFYVQPMQPPPPPLYHYQWPMPMPYDPYSSVPGLGYSMPGMVMPPFPLHPYMEVPGYVLPHAQLHPTEYRQYQFPPAAMAYQNNSRSRVFYQNPPSRQMANTEVQTEPLPDVSGRPTSVNSLGGADSGRGTNTPSSTSSYAEKPSCPERECNSPPSSPVRLQGLEKAQGVGTGVPVETTTVHSRRNSTDVLGKTVHGGNLVHRDVWSVCSADVMVPMCSSSEQEDEVIMADRRVSSSTDVQMDREPTSKMERTPECDQTRTHKETTHEGSTVVQPGRSGLECVLSVINDLAPDSKVNESVWSVESLAAYVPSIDWMIQNGLMDPEGEEQKLSERMSEKASDQTDQSQMSFHFTQVPKKLNASVWSVQSSAPYIPSKEILRESDCKDPGSIIEKDSEVDISRGFSASQVLAITERRRSQRLSVTLENVEALRMSSEDTIPDEESFHFSQVPKNMNESVWSVQSLASYIPSREWFIQNGILDPEKELGTVSEGVTASQVLAVTERSQRLSLSSIDTNVSHVSSSSWLADLGNVYYYGKLPLGSQENGNVDIPEHSTQSSTCLLEDPEIHVSECLEGDKDPGDFCPIPHDQEMETVKETAKQTELVVPSQQDCELISGVKTLTDTSPNRNLKICGPMCLKQINCLCEEPMLNMASFKKSPAGETEGSVAKMPLDHRFQEQQHRIARQKWQMDSKRGRRARPNNESSENGYGLNSYSKNMRHRQSRPLKAHAQTNPSNNPFGQGNGDEEPWNGYARSRKTRGANGGRRY
ncbi:hypothetical protein UPYG_G00290680 [Umbra pygmaea]|uniref:Uncharacterized protein n=1 Tax=Umbra pygmaea TaxID=75934 RepID=A0ABD0W4P5_UMBPY